MERTGEFCYKIENTEAALALFSSFTKKRHFLRAIAAAGLGPVMSILIVDDTPVNLVLLEDILKQEGYNDIHCVTSAAEAFTLLAQSGAGVDLILMDLVMPGMDGIEACRQIKAQERIKDIPVVMITVRDDTEALQQAFAAGANDYIIKPVKEAELLSRVRAVMRLKREIDRRKAREAELLRMTEKLEMINKTLENLINIDSLTEVGNRRYFDQLLKNEWHRAVRRSDPIALLMIDIDDFKAYNDTYGHQKGDFCLKQVAAALNEVIKRAGDFVVRYGGEEFAVVLPNTDMEGAIAVAEQLKDSITVLNIPHEQSSVGNTLTVSIGIASGIPREGIDRQQIVAAADSALYVAKSEGRNRIKVATESCL